MEELPGPGTLSGFGGDYPPPPVRNLLGQLIV
jgi:hypothetical protein